ESQLRSAQKFRVPEDGSLLGVTGPGKNTLSIFREFGIRLPYPVTALEFNNSPFVGDQESRSAVDATVVIASNIPGQSAKSGAMVEGLYIYSFFRLRSGKWLPSTHLAIVTEDEDEIRFSPISEDFPKMSVEEIC